MTLAYVLVLLLLALLLFWQAGRQQRAAGLPGGRVIYTDTRAWGQVPQPLYDPVLKLTGKPDYLVKDGKRVVPVEVKTGRTPEAPYDSHIYQLAAYCVLVEREYGVRPPYGIVHYPKRTFAVDFTPQLESALLDLLTEMRRAESRGSADRSHEDAHRCRGCGYWSVCEQRL